MKSADAGAGPGWRQAAPCLPGRRFPDRWCEPGLAARQPGPTPSAACGLCDLGGSLSLGLGALFCNRSVHNRTVSLARGSPADRVTSAPRGTCGKPRWPRICPRSPVGLCGEDGSEGCASLLPPRGPWAQEAPSLAAPLHRLLRPRTCPGSSTPARLSAGWVTAVGCPQLCKDFGRPGLC